MKILWEIWRGQYDLGQGMGKQLIEPEKLAEIYASSFQCACLKYVLQESINYLDRTEDEEKMPDLDRWSWDYNHKECIETWSGRLFSSREEALKTF